jgi:Flp pilus assembly protein TadD
LRLVDARIAELQVSPELVMGEGLKALYERHDAAGAVQRFRRVLELQPSHYGASFQLAAALQAAGERDAARQAYQRSLQMAREQRDAQTVRLIEERLRQIGQ